MTLVTGLRAARLRRCTLSLAIRRWRPGGRPRRLRRPLELQDKLNQLFLAQLSKLVTIHPNRESQRGAQRKGGVGNYYRSAADPAAEPAPVRAIHCPATHACMCERDVSANYSSGGVIRQMGMD